MRTLNITCEIEKGDPSVGIFGDRYSAYATNIDDESICIYSLSEPHFIWTHNRPSYAIVIEQTLAAYVNASLAFDEPAIILDDDDCDDPFDDPTLKRKILTAVDIK